jgi:hypothetical protein
MKTTIDIPDALLRQAKRLAAQEDTTLKELIEGALRDKLARARAKPAPGPVTTHTFRGRGLQPGASFDDWATLRGMIYEGRGG